jgi:hypothetical protein
MLNKVMVEQRCQKHILIHTLGQSISIFGTKISKFGCSLFQISINRTVHPYLPTIQIFYLVKYV